MISVSLLLSSVYLGNTSKCSFTLEAVYLSHTKPFSGSVRGVVSDTNTHFSIPTQVYSACGVSLVLKFS